MPRHKNSTVNGRDPEISTKSGSFALFGDDDLVSIHAGTAETSHKAVKAVQNGNETKLDRSQPANEKPDSSEPVNKKAGRNPTRGFRAIKINQIDPDTESRSGDAKRHDNKEVGRKRGKPGEKEQGKSGGNKGTECKSCKTKREVQVGKRGTSVQKGKSTTGENLDYTKYSLKEFPDNTIIQTYTITGKPKPTKDWSVVEIIINGSRYKVSAWSIKNNQYIQGLDSRFLVQHFHK